MDTLKNVVSVGDAVQKLIHWILG